MADKIFRNVFHKTPQYDPNWAYADETTYPKPIRQQIPNPIAALIMKDEATPRSEENRPILPYLQNRE